MCGESSHIDSGFGNYTKNILSRLYATNKYEIAELSAYRTVHIPKTEPWIIYPNAPSDPEAMQAYSSNPANAFGAWGFEIACLDFKPDIVMDIRDYWMFNFVETSSLREYFHWFVAPTIDSAPQKSEWIQTFSGIDTLSAHTQWGIDYLKTLNLSCNIVNPVNDSVDTDIFRVLSQTSEISKNNLGLNPSDFIIGTVMRNQKRKLIPNLIKIISDLNKKYPNIKLYLHTSYPDISGWDIPKLLIEHNASNIVYFTYKCQVCKKHFASLYQEPPNACKHCKNKSATVCNVSNGVNSHELCSIYNAFDTYIQYAICEGFGIPPVEAAACGIPVITVDHGAMREVGNNIGADIVSLASIFRELETNADRVCPDDNMCKTILEKKYLDITKLSLSDKISHKEKIRSKLVESYSWDKTAKQFENILDNIQLVNKQGKWDCVAKLPNPEIKVPPLPSNRQIIYFILDHVINMPYLKNSASVQNIIHGTDNGYMVNNGKIQKFEIKDAIKSLENLMNGKTFWENLRLGNVKRPERFDYMLNYK